MLSRVRTSQPLQFVGVNWSNPITRNLVGLVNHGFMMTNDFRNAFNCVTMVRPTVVGATFPPVVDTPIGIAATFPNDTNCRYDSPVLTGMSGSTTFTVLSLQTVTLASANQNTLDSDDGGGTRVFQLRLNTANKVELIRFDTGGGAYFATDGTAVTSAQAANGVFIGAVSNGNSMSAWCDRRKTTGTISNTPKGMTTTITVGLNRFIAQPLQGKMLMWAAFTRALSDEEMLSLVDNPWQLFVPAQPRILAGRLLPADVTLSFPNSPSVNDTYTFGCNTYTWDGTSWRLCEETATTYTPGSVIFAGASGGLTEDNPNLFFDNANNRVGIGTNAPAFGFHLKGSTAIAVSQGTGTGAGDYGSLFATNSNTANSIGFQKLSTGYTTGGVMTANAGVVTNGGGGNMVLLNNPSTDMIFCNGGSGAEKMRLDVNGKLGIGTTPTQMLHVKAPTTVNGYCILDTTDTNVIAGVLTRSNTAAICNVSGTGSTWTPTFTLGAASQGVFDALGAGGALIMASNASGVVKIAAGGNATANEVANFSALGMKFPQLGAGLYFKEGTNAISGLATLVAGTVTVNTTKTTASCRIYLTVQTAGGTQGFLRIASRTAGTSFTITSTNAAETSTVAWLIVEPA